MFLIRWFLLPMIKPVLDNMRETELWLESECDKRINWTVVRPAGLTNSLRTDKEFKVELDQFHVSLAQLNVKSIQLVSSRSPGGPGGLPEPTWRGSCCPASRRRNIIRKGSLSRSDLLSSIHYTNTVHLTNYTTICDNEARKHLYSHFQCSWLLYFYLVTWYRYFNFYSSRDEQTAELAGAPGRQS